MEPTHEQHFLHGHNVTITDRWRALLMQEFNKTKVSKDASEPPQPELMSKEEGKIISPY